MWDEINEIAYFSFMDHFQPFTFKYTIVAESGLSGPLLFNVLRIVDLILDIVFLMASTLKSVLIVGL